MDKLIQRAIDFRLELDKMLDIAKKVDPKIYGISFDRCFGCKESTELAILKEKWKNLAVTNKDRECANKEAKVLLKEMIVLAIYETLICRPYISSLEIYARGVKSYVKHRELNRSNIKKVDAMFHYCILDTFEWTETEIKEVLAEIASENQCEHFSVNIEGRIIIFN